MSTPPARTSGAAPLAALQSVEDRGTDKDTGDGAESDTTRAFSQVRLPGHVDAHVSNELDLADAVKLLAALYRPRKLETPDGPADIGVPEAIAQDSRRRMAYRFGVQAARGLGLDIGEFGVEELIVLGRETIIDHIASGKTHQVLANMARLEGKLDEAAWAADDREKIAEQVNAFVQSEFKDEIDLYNATQALAAQPPLFGRQDLAEELLRQQGIKPEARLIGADAEYAYNRYSPRTSGRQYNWKAGDYYFNRDCLKAESIRKMETLGGSTPSDEHIARVIEKLPVSLDAEFGRRFDAYKKTVAANLSTWFAARLSLHAKEVPIDLANATVTIERPKMCYLIRRIYDRTWSKVYVPHSELAARGFLISIRAADRVHRCFIWPHTGTIKPLPAGVSTADWLKQHASELFDEAKTRTELAAQSREWYSKIAMQAIGTGSHAGIPEWMSSTFQTDIEQEREAARGQTTRERAIDGFLNMIPFRAMIVSLQKADIGMAIVWGGLDALSILSLIPIVGPGARAAGAVARAAGMPLTRVGSRLTGMAARQVANTLRVLPHGLSGLRHGIRTSLLGTAARSWASLRPLDVLRVADALRGTSPRLARILERLAARATACPMPDGVWQIRRGSMATSNQVRRVTVTAAGPHEAIGPLPTIKAHDPTGRGLALLPYGEGVGTYTQVDSASGARIGALLVANRDGWLYQTLPMASLERYRVGSMDVVQALEGGRIGTDGTVVRNGVHYARIGADYFEVVPDRSASTVNRPVWRIVPADGVSPDIVPHRLVHDEENNVWRHTEAPTLSGQGSGYSRLLPKVSPARKVDARIGPSAQQRERYCNALVSSTRGATPAQADALRAVLDRMRGEPRGQAILNALHAYHELHGQMPNIVLRDTANAAQARPSMDEPVWTSTWYVDLEALKASSTDTAIQELAAVYSNMSGLLRSVDPFRPILAKGQPALDPDLERAWRAWLGEDPDRRFRFESQPGHYVSVGTPRENAVNFLRERLREMRCYGGLDRSTFIQVLRNEGDGWHASIDLSRRELVSVPPLPSDMTSLTLSHNTIRDWRYLPANLTVLRADGTDMAALPPNLPAGLLELNVSNNMLGGASLVLPSGLKRLFIGRNGLTVLPALPDTLEELRVHRNWLRKLPDELPRGLKVLDATFNELARLPEPLPSGLESLLVANNRFARLPDRLPAGLRILNASVNRLVFLPALPDTLVTLDVSNNLLETLPSNLPRGLTVLMASRNRLRALTEDLPSGLTLLDVQWNTIADLPPGIVALASCSIHMDGNPILVRNLPIAPADRAGPRFFFSMVQVEAVSPRPTDLSQAIGEWLNEQPEEVLSRWEAIGTAVQEQESVREFDMFLHRLRNTVSSEHEAFRAQVVEWLVELSKPERKALLDDTLAICRGATETCEDRVICAWNALQTLRRNDDVRRGLYDGRIKDVVDCAREMFRIHALTGIARNKVRTLAVSDELEVYLAYAVGLRDSLQLTTVAPAMRYFDSSFVSHADLAAAREAVLEREREEFNKFLVLDYEPWQTLLKRKNPQAYAAAEAAAHEALEDRFEQMLAQEVAKLGLSPDQANALADARKDLGPRIMREIRYQVMEPPTRALRDG